MATGNSTVDDIVGWQTDPKERGTVTLIWGCVTTIFACSWTILHLNVPALTDSAWTRFRRKAKWMAITIVFPEFILSKAICELRLALRELCEFDEYVQRDENIMKWRASYNLNLRSWEDEWSWKVEYPRHARWLYRLLFLKPPLELSGGGLSSSNEAESTGDKWRGRFPHYNRWLYRLLFPKPSRDKGGEDLSLPNEMESEGVELNTSRNNGGEQKQMEEEIHGRQNYRTGSEQDLEARVGGYDSSDDGRESSPPNTSSRSSKRVTRSSPSQMACHLGRRTQVWTLVHSYFAQMGGLAWINKCGPSDTLCYFVLSSSMLTQRYHWFDTHPLERLVLGREDIEDKSKADSVVKSIAVLQIAWLIFNVLGRAIKKLPITQIEIATIAFAVMSIFTYAINWWKPKDVSQPIRLLPSCIGCSRSSDLMQSFMTRLRRPHQAAQDSRNIPDLKRVPNDLVWMEGKTPLFYHLLGITSLVFGSLHCIAWNFQFPTRTELHCWRVVSLLSATLPGTALGLSMVMGYLRTSYVAKRRRRIFLHKLQPLESISEEWWEHLLKPKFREWNHDVQVAFMGMPKASNTDWEMEPSEEIVASLGTSEKGRDRYRMYSKLSKGLIDFHGRWRGRQSEEDHKLQSGESWLLLCSWIAGAYGGFHDEYDFREFWRGYEDFVERKLVIPPAKRLETSCVETIIKAYEETSAEVERLEVRLDLAVKMVEALNGCGGIIYIACRVMTIVLLFTCLRAAPAGVYQVGPWTTFIPGIS